MKKISIALFGFFCFAAGLQASCQAADRRDEAKIVPVQHNGRIKPFDSFARQTLKFVSGHETFEGKDATTFLTEQLSDRNKIRSLKFIRVDLPELKKSFGLPENENFFSLTELEPFSDKIVTWLRASKAKRDKDQRPSKLEQKAEQLYSKMQTAQGLISGESGGSPTAAEQSPGLKNKLYLEVLYNQTKPLESAAALYFLAFFLLSFFKKNQKIRLVGYISSALAVFFHSVGLGLRIYILSRPPVSNMYESMIFMNWALMVFALIFTAVRKNAVPLTAACALSGFVMLYGNLLPIDSSLDVVVAVLRSTYWLTLHVLTVVSSYGAFGLAMALGHRHLFLTRMKKLNKKSEEESAQLIFKVVQLGTLLIGAGTFLGGVWANESWGRFWGWDPKETWALITFLGYLVVVHLKYAKKISNFYLALSSVIGFLLVLMTWYGVNFVLGRGLHSYGAGSGGMVWVVYYLVLETIFLGWVLSRK